MIYPWRNSLGFVSTHGVAVVSKWHEWCFSSMEGCNLSPNSYLCFFCSLVVGGNQLPFVSAKCRLYNCWHFYIFLLFSWILSRLIAVQVVLLIFWHYCWLWWLPCHSMQFFSEIPWCGKVKFFLLVIFGLPGKAVGFCLAPKRMALFFMDDGQPGVTFEANLEVAFGFPCFSNVLVVCCLVVLRLCGKGGVFSHMYIYDDVFMYIFYLVIYLFMYLFVYLFIYIYIYMYICYSACRTLTTQDLLGKFPYAWNDKSGRQWSFHRGYFVCLGDYTTQIVSLPFHQPQP